MANLNELSANSDAAREAAEEQAAVEEYTPIEKVSIFARILNTFGIEPDLGGALGSVWEDVIKPTFLDGCRDSMYTLADYFFGGGGGKTSHRGTGKKGEKHTAYSEKFKSGRPSRGKAPNSAVYYIPLDDRAKVLDKLNEMWDVVNQCDFCSVEDCLIIFEKKPTSNYMLGDWGWTASDLKNVRAVRNEDGEFYLNLPKPRAKED